MHLHVLTHTQTHLNLDVHSLLHIYRGNIVSLQFTSKTFVLLIVIVNCKLNFNFNLKKSNRYSNLILKNLDADA